MAEQKPSTSILDSFTKPALTQTTSQLFQLSAEIRAGILRELLISPVPIPAVKRMVAYDEHFRPIYQPLFSTAILESCQRMYGEGSNLLYCENTLSLVIKGEVCCVRPKHGFSCALTFGHSMEAEESPDYDEEESDKAIAFMSRFRKFAVTLRSSHSEHHWETDTLITIFRKLQTVMSGKIIQVNVHNVLHASTQLQCRDCIDASSLCMSKSFTDHTQVNLNLLRFWRCQSITFRNVDEQLWTNTAEIVLSQAPMVDVPALVDKLKHAVFSEWYLEYEALAWQERHNLLEALKAAKWDFDLDVYLEIRPKLLAIQDDAFLNHVKSRKKLREELDADDHEVQAFQASMEGQALDQIS